MKPRRPAALAAAIALLLAALSPAFHAAPSLVMSGVGWQDGSFARWDNVPGAHSYVVVLCHDDEFGPTLTVGGESGGETGYTIVDMRPEFNGPGEYTFIVFAADADSRPLTPASTSPPIIVAEETATRPTPTNPRWERDGDGVYALWDAPDGLTRADSYVVEIYGGGERLQEFPVRGRSRIPVDGRWTPALSRGERSRELTFAVRTVSDGQVAPDSPLSAHSEPYPFGETVDDLNDRVLALTQKVRDGLPVRDALPEIQALPTEALALSMHDDELCENLRALEELLELSGTTIQAIPVWESVGVDLARARAVGAGLNAYGPHSNTEIRFSQWNYELRADEGWDVALPLGDAWDTAPLIASLSIDGFAPTRYEVPVRITMPIPDGLCANGLRIYHKQVSDIEVIFPEIHPDGTCSFTLTWFGTLVFASPSQSYNPATGR